MVVAGVRRSLSVVNRACCGMALPEDVPWRELSRLWTSAEAAAEDDVASWEAAPGAEVALNEETNQQNCSKAGAMSFIDLAGTDTVHERGHARVPNCDHVQPKMPILDERRGSLHCAFAQSSMLCRTLPPNQKRR